MPSAAQQTWATEAGDLEFQLRTPDSSNAALVLSGDRVRGNIHRRATSIVVHGSQFHAAKLLLCKRSHVCVCVRSLHWKPIAEKSNVAVSI
jgi:hypothetical protein